MTRWSSLAAVLCVGCAPSFSFTGDAVESLPQYAASGQALTSGLSISGEPQLAILFRQECHQQPRANYCPAGVDVTTGGEANPHKFTVTSLLGLIFHAELYAGGFKTSCTGHAAVLSPTSFASATTGGDGAHFLLDTYSLFDCVETSDAGDTVRHRAYSVADDYQASVITSHRVSTGEGSPPSTDLYQVYVGVDGTRQPTLLAFNWAGISTMGARAVLLVNLRTHRFAVKYLWAPPPGATVYRFVNAVGVGGVDRASGAPRPGFYAARYSDEATGEKTACVDNATQLLELDDAECRAAGVPVAWSSSDDVAAWLDLSAAEKTRLAAFLARFTDSAPLPQADTPTSQDDADLLFPARID